MISLTSPRFVFAGLFCASVVFIAGCGETIPVAIAPLPTPDAESAGVSGIVNTVCPIMGGEATSEVSVDWNGKKVGFCCPPCIEEWQELTDTEREQKIASAKAKPHG